MNSEKGETIRDRFPKDGLSNDDMTREIWAACKKYISEHITNMQTFVTWIEPIVPCQLTEQIIELQTPSEFFKEWIEDHHHALIKDAIIAVMGETIEIKYSVSSKTKQENSYQATFDAGQSVSTIQTKIHGHSNQHSEFFNETKKRFQIQLNSKYTFDTLVKGSCNDLAIAAAKSIAENPGTSAYNPFVVYGNVGLGKTHIAQAIANYCIEHKKTNFVLYISSDDFRKHMVESLEKHKMREFSAFYRSIDLLIIDDIQFLTGSEKTQEELFHIFNTMHQSNRQIVLSCDRPIKDLKGIENRLVTRFQWGLAADLQTPDYETRLAIFYKKMEESNIVFPEEVVEFVAKNVDTSVRELEGCIIRLLASSSLEKKEITLETSQEFLKDIIRTHSLHITTQIIEKEVCKFYSISINDLKSKSRKQEIAHARQVCMYLFKGFIENISLKTIGLHFGGRDHSTVIHACNTIENFIKDNSDIQRQIEQLQKQIRMNA